MSFNKVPKVPVLVDSHKDFFIKRKNTEQKSKKKFRYIKKRPTSFYRGQRFFLSIFVPSRSCVNLNINNNEVTRPCSEFGIGHSQIVISISDFPNQNFRFLMH